MRLEVVTIGTELVLGLTADTNAAELSRALASVGAEVVRLTAVPDRPDAIRDAVSDALARTGAVITTGGLGPTRDDMTKHAVAEVFDLPLQLDAAVLRMIEERFRRLGRRMAATNRAQAEVPAGATVLPNPRGTAPGLWIEKAGRLAVLLPGVPTEMRGLLADEVLPRLAARVGAAGSGAGVVRSRAVRTTGVPESTLAERIGEREQEIAAPPLTLAYIPSLAGVDLRVTAWHLAPAEAARRLDRAIAMLQDLAGADCYGEDDTDLAAVLLERLRARGIRLAVAESCTGGLVAERLTAVAGASDVFVGGVVAYDNAVKRGSLNVAADLLEAQGAVSEPVVRAMLEGVRRRWGTPAGLAVTGIAGPSGGTPEKPIGTVWLAAGIGDETRAVRRLFPGDRAEIRARAAQAALDLLRRMLPP